MNFMLIKTVLFEDSAYFIFSKTLDMRAFATLSNFLASFPPTLCSCGNEARKLHRGSKSSRI